MGSWGGMFQNYDAPLQGTSSNQWGATLPPSNPTTTPGIPTPSQSGGTTITGGNGNIFNGPGQTGAPGVPTTSTYGGAIPNASSAVPTSIGGLPTLGSSSSANNNAGSIISPLSPSESQGFLEWLSTQIGQGLPGFQGSVNLPSGGQTQPGQLTAQENPTLMQLQTFLQGGGSGGNPVFDALTQMATTGDPTNVTPEWQAMVAAMQQPIEQQYAQLQEQFGAAGGAQSSVYGNALQDFASQTALGEQSLLGQLQAQASEAAASRKQTGQNMLLGADTSMSQYLQTLDQSAINNLIQNYYATLPQYNPMNSSEYGAAVTFPPYVSGSYGTSGVAPALGAAASLIPTSSASGAGSATSTPATFWG